MTEEKRIFYLKRLNHPDIGVRKEAINQLGALGDPHIFKILSSHFSDSHPEIREVLFRVFSANISRRNAEIVADTLHSPQLSVRSLAMEILKTMQSEAVLPLRRLSKSNKPAIRKIAAELLGDIQDDHSSDILTDIIQDDDESVRLAVIEALGKQKDIRAVPNLLILYEKDEQHKPAILGALNKIFLHWEKFVLRSDFVDADPWLAMAFVNVVQDNGNASALPLIIRWLKGHELNDIKDELLKAFESVLTKNVHLVLPNYLLPIILEIWQQYSDEMSKSIFYTCLSRIPSNDALDILLQDYEQEPENSQLENALLHFITIFLPIFLNQYPQIQMSIRTRILELLLEKNVQVYDSELLDLRDKIKHKKEKSLLLNLAVNSRMPGAKKILLAKLSGSKNHQLETLLDKLLNFNDESLWELYFKYISDSSPVVREKAFKGLQQYPQQTVNYLLNFPQKQNDEVQLFWLDVVFQLPPSYVNQFLREWLKDMNKGKLEMMATCLVERNHLTQIPIVIQHLKNTPEYLDTFKEIFKSRGYDLKLIHNAEDLSPQETSDFSDTTLPFDSSSSDENVQSEIKTSSPTEVELK